MSKYIKVAAIMVLSGVVTFVLFPGVQSLLMPNTELFWEVKISNNVAWLIAGAVTAAWLVYVIFLFRRKG